MSKRRSILAFAPLAAALLIVAVVLVVAIGLITGSRSPTPTEDPGGVAALGPSPSTATSAGPILQTQSPAGSPSIAPSDRPATPPPTPEASPALTTPAPLPTASPTRQPPVIPPPTQQPTPGSDEPSDELRLRRVESITGGLSPKSVVASQTGLFFAQNMMYRHTISVFDREFERVKTIRDSVDLAKFGFSSEKRVVRGAPVEAAFSPDRRYVYISQYSMYGPGFPNPGADDCSPAERRDDSFVYRIDVETLKIDQLIKVGATPKYLAVSPDGRYLVVTNWCSYDVSIVRTSDGGEVERITVGRYPRGIAIDPGSTTAYVGIMGGTDIAKIDLDTFRLRWIRDVGPAPRHLVMEPAGRFMYVTLAGGGGVIKIDLTRDRTVARVQTGDNPRSMDISPDGRSLYVGNYEGDTVSKVRTRDMTVLQTLPTAYHPIGITYDGPSRQLWVACYSGVIQVFEDR